MKQPTYQQVSELYHELWQLQRDCEELEKKCKGYEEVYRAEEEYSCKLISIINRAHECLMRGETEKALEALKAP